MSRIGTSISWDDLRLDVEYLADELVAFKGLVEWIPFDERPLGQQSISDMLGTIQHVQFQVVVPLLSEWEQTQSDGTRIEGSTALDKLLFGKEGYSDQPEQQVEGSVLELLDRIVETRKHIIDSLHLNSGYASEKRIALNGHDVSLSEVIQAMVKFERSKLRKIGERIQAMETDRRG